MKYRENHYVPIWYQERFLPTVGEKKFYYLNLSPEQFRDPKGILRTKNALHRWGAVSCFKETDLYTTKYGEYESTAIEQFFFGKVDDDGRRAINFLSSYKSFKDIQADTDLEKIFYSLLNYISVQKFRTPKGLIYLSNMVGVNNQNRLLFELQRLQNLHCAIWAESVWALADATTTKTKFIISDHPVTVYNREIFPDSLYSKEFTDPDFRMNGTHTYFPLSPTRILILTNLSWARNPYGNGKKYRPNSQPFRPAMFNFTDIQTGRELNEDEVLQINYITKRRALRYIAAADKDSLYPELNMETTNWRKLDDRYLFMPDPRDIHLGGEILIGYKDGHTTAFDEYGRRPWQADYKKSDNHRLDERLLYTFQGEFARLFGPKRRGTSDSLGGRRIESDSEKFHQILLDQEKKYRPSKFRPRKDARTYS